MGGFHVMPRGWSICRICGKYVPCYARRNHEKVRCLKMRFDRGDADVRKRFPNGLPPRVRREVPVAPGQLRLLEVLR